MKVHHKTETNLIAHVSMRPTSVYESGEAWSADIYGIFEVPEKISIGQSFPSLAELLDYLGKYNWDVGSVADRRAFRFTVTMPEWLDVPIRARGLFYRYFDNFTLHEVNGYRGGKETNGIGFEYVSARDESAKVREVAQLLARECDQTPVIVTVERIEAYLATEDGRSSVI